MRPADRSEGAWRSARHAGAGADAAALRERAGPLAGEMAADLRPLLEVRRRLGRRDALAAAIADPAKARAAVRAFTTPPPVDRAAPRPAATAAPAWREIVPSDPARADIVYLHGGGLVFHDVEAFRPVLERIGHGSARGVAALDYPKAPEHAPKAILGGILRELGRRASAGRPFILAGDSIGALIALHAASTVDLAGLERLVLICPVLNLREDRHFASYERYGSGYLLEADFMGWFRALAREALPADFDPLRLAEAARRRLPPLFVASAQCDMLADEAAAFADRLARQGLGVAHRVHAGMPHDFLLQGWRSAQAAQAIEALIRDGFR